MTRTPLATKYFSRHLANAFVRSGISLRTEDFGRINDLTQDIYNAFVKHKCPPHERPGRVRYRDLEQGDRVFDCELGTSAKFPI